MNTFTIKHSKRYLGKSDLEIDKHIKISGLKESRYYLYSIMDGSIYLILFFILMGITDYIVKIINIDITVYPPLIIFIILIIIYRKKRIIKKNNFIINFTDIKNVDFGRNDYNIKLDMTNGEIERIVTTGKNRKENAKEIIELIKNSINI